MRKQSSKKIRIDLPDGNRRRPKTMVVLMPGSDNEVLLSLASCLSKVDSVLLLGIVPVPEGENLSAGQTEARKLRRLFIRNIDRKNLRAKARIRVTYTPWDAVRMALADEPDIDLLFLEWPQQLKALQLTAAELLSHPPCDVALLRGPFPEKIADVLLPNLGDPHGERAVRLSLALTRKTPARITSLFLRTSEKSDEFEQGFLAMQQMFEEMPDVEQKTIVTKARTETILKMSKDFDLVVMGTRATPTQETNSFGEITDAVLEKSPTPVIAIKTKTLIPDPKRFGAGAISVLVDRWFAENTFHANEFANLSQLVSLKEERGLTISVALPALNEEDTIGDVIRAIQRMLMEQAPLIDEIILMDSNSTDRTREIAVNLGIPVYIHQEVLPRYGIRSGKGEALWKSLFVTRGDIVIWVDTDIRNFHPRFIYGLIGPLLLRTKLVFVKGFYRRPLRTSKGLQPGRGGRVTELTARPLFNLFYPALSGVIQPLSGEYGGRREALEQLTFSSGYGVETALLIDVFEKFKLTSIAQVDLLERIHKNQSLTNLGKMSFAIIQTFISKLERRYGQAMVQDINRTMKIVNYEPGHYYLDVEEIAELERPPMVEIPEYRKKWNLGVNEEEPA